MAEAKTESLEESPLDLALANARRTFDPDEPADDDAEARDGDGQMGGHPAQEEDTEEDEDVGSSPPAQPVTPPAAPVTPTPAPLASDPSAEARRIEAEQRMNLAIGEANALKAERDRLMREVDEARRPATPTETIAPKDLPDIKAARATVRQKLQEITAIDNKLADYWERLEEGYVGMIDPLIQARATEVFQNLSPTQQTAMRQALLKDPEFLDALKTAIVPGVQSQVVAEAENTRAFNYVVEEAKKAGFDVSGQGEDPELFWNVAVAHTDRALPQGTMEEKTARALDIMRSLKGVPTSVPTPPADPPAAERPARTVRQPMTRQSAGPVTSGTEETPEQPASLDDALKATHGRLRA